MRFRAQVGLAMYQCRLNDPGDVVHCCRKDTQLPLSQAHFDNPEKGNFEGVGEAIFN